MLPDYNSRTRTSRVREGDPLREFLSEDQGRIVTANNISNTIVAPPSRSDGDTDPFGGAHIPVVEAKIESVFGEPLLQFLSEARERVIECDEVRPPYVGAVPHVDAKSLRPEGVRGTEPLGGSALVEAKTDPLADGRVLAAGPSPTRRHPVRVSLALTVAGASVASAVFLLALHAAKGATLTETAVTSPRQASGEPPSSSMKVRLAPNPVLATRPANPVTAALLAPVGATVSKPEARLNPADEWARRCPPAPARPSSSRGAIPRFARGDIVPGRRSGVPQW